MPVILDVNQGKGFTTMIKNILAIFILGGILFVSSCGNDDTPPIYNEIPDIPVNITINTDLPSYFHLKNVGTYVYETGGNRGVVVIHNFDDVYYAFERTCTYQPDLACSKIFVDSVSLNLRCGGFADTSWTPCCSSLYGYNGIPTQGPSRYQLKQYRIIQNGSILTVRN